MKNKKIHKIRNKLRREMTDNSYHFERRFEERGFTYKEIKHFVCSSKLNAEIVDDRCIFENDDIRLVVGVKLIDKRVPLITIIRKKLD